MYYTLRCCHFNSSYLHSRHSLPCSKWLECLFDWLAWKPCISSRFNSIKKKPFYCCKLIFGTFLIQYASFFHHFYAIIKVNVRNGLNCLHFFFNFFSVWNKIHPIMDQLYLFFFIVFCSSPMKQLNRRKSSFEANFPFECAILTLKMWWAQKQTLMKMCQRKK